MSTPTDKKCQQLISKLGEMFQMGAIAPATRSTG